jgi:hypothetical protein
MGDFARGAKGRMYSNIYKIDIFDSSLNHNPFRKNG